MSRMTPDGLIDVQGSLRAVQDRLKEVQDGLKVVFRLSKNGPEWC